MIAPRFLPVVIAPHPPTEWKRTAMLPSGKQRRRIVRLHFVRMVDAERHEPDAVIDALAVLAGSLTRGELVRANRVLGPEVARSQTVDAREQPRHLIYGYLRNPCLSHQRLVQRRADVSTHRVIAGQRLVCSLQDDDVLLPGQRVDDRRLGKRPEHVRVNRPDLHAPRLAHVIDGGFDVLGG